MDIMKPVINSDVPLGAEWIYEIKYDGFRCVLEWAADGTVLLKSRNNHDLTANFPEIEAFCLEIYPTIKAYLPLTLDGELVVLNHSYQANFSQIQKRGRLKNKVSIQKAAHIRPAQLIIFDLLELKGKSYRMQKLSVRKIGLESLFRKLKGDRLKLVESFQSPEAIEKAAFDFKAEGMVAKRTTSTYINGKRHHDWLKIKNWRKIQVFLTAYDMKNDYFHVGVFHEENVKAIGKCKHGLDAESFQTLKQLFLTNGKKQGQLYMLPPAVCASIHTLDLYKEELREPQFANLLPHIKPEDCTFEKLQLDLAMLPESIDLTNTEKELWPDVHYTKGNLLTYMREVSPYMLPFLENRLLTVIRCPDGIDQEHFFQKHLPSYAPDFITTIPSKDGNAFICDRLESLIWFANHGAVEYHIPFQTAHSSVPSEIAFDLDPPDREHFHLAIHAAQLIKSLLDELSLTSFVKTSGNKGIQIHIPIREGSMTYEETATFTQAIAFTIENTYSDYFTTERMKNKRNGRLYLDYVQHGKDKTLIAPYSPRKTKDGTVATPLFWDEVKEGLDPGQFTIGNVIERVKQFGCPFANYFTLHSMQDMRKVLKLVRE
ncbi:DNA ligase D [Oceanobacillus chungangensis]|uniref:DNA ligase (ATP) n=1 Tax=Oceanobacillus chungangensis TaxID=1229152 RepID=A0A3D8PJG9_9BACI|nr:DNA ligase D [Oceanobacillus chungangensis]RDW15368.1 DNA ligase D [Oceanobacillus chungangensis]